MSNHLSYCEPTFARPTLASSQRQHQSRMVFWASLVVVGVGLYMSIHSARHALNATGDRVAEAELSESVGGSNRARQLSYLAIGGLGLALLFKQQALCQGVSDQLLWGLLAALIAFVLLSAGWSDSIALSLKRSLIPLLTCLAALGLARHVRPRDICLFAFLLSAAFVLIGVAMECKSSTFLRGVGYRFSGTLHPNRQAVNCTILCLSAVCLSVRSGPWRRYWWAAFAVGLGMLVLTRSRTGLISCSVGVLLIWSTSLSRGRRQLLFIGMVLLGGFAALFAISSQDSVSDILMNAVRIGREQETEDVTSLTGRIPIWTALVQEIANRPILGYGYGGFWTEERVVELSYLLDWEFDHAHSIYVESALNVGLLGMGLGVAVVVVALRRAAFEYRRTHDVGFLFALAILTTAAIHGLLDTIYIRPGLGLFVGLSCVGMLLFHGRQILGTGEI